MKQLKQHIKRTGLNLAAILLGLRVDYHIFMCRFYRKRGSDKFYCHVCKANDRYEELLRWKTRYLFGAVKVPKNLTGEQLIQKMEQAVADLEQRK